MFAVVFPFDTYAVVHPTDSEDIRGLRLHSEASVC